jgi:hypothetical protein
LRCCGKRQEVVGGQIIHKLYNLSTKQIYGRAFSETSGASQCSDVQTPKYAHMHPYLPDADLDGEPEINYNDYDDLVFGHWFIDGIGPQATPQAHLLVTDLSNLGKADCQWEFHSFFKNLLSVSVSLDGPETTPLPSIITWDILSPLQTVNKLLDECALWEQARLFTDFRHMPAIIQLTVYIDRYIHSSFELLAL